MIQSWLQKKKLIVDICRTLVEHHSSTQWQSYRSDDVYDNCGPRVLEISESCYRSYLFDNCLKAAARYLRNINHNVTFFPGEIELNAMTLQLKQEGMNDRRYKYNADGTLRVNDLSATEILLTEVSSGYGSSDAGKISFDHYKAMFGMLAMIRTVAQLYNEATFNTFTKTKIHFIHAHGKLFKVHHRMCVCVTRNSILR